MAKDSSAPFFCQDKNIPDKNIPSFLRRSPEKILLAGATRSMDLNNRIYPMLKTNLHYYLRSLELGKLGSDPPLLWAGHAGLDLFSRETDFSLAFLFWMRQGDTRGGSISRIKSRASERV